MSQKIGKFEVLEKIGEGGFGVIFKGRDPHIERLVAIKTCTSEDADIRDRFAQEARIAGNLHHRHIVTVYDLGEEQGVPYLVQEYLSGEDLDRKIKRRDYIPFPEKLLYLVQIARGLEHAHRQGVVHRDVKPANIRILDDGTTKIMDFGIAKLANEETGLTQTGMTLGTASYLAPEQIKGEPVDPRTDIFSYGVTAYELLTYRRPFVGQHMSTILYQILHEEPPPPSRFAPGLPSRLDALVMKCLEKDPGRRYDDVGALMKDLGELLEARRTGVSAADGPVLDEETHRRTRVLPARDPVPSDPVPRSVDSFGVANPAPLTAADPVRPHTLDDLELDVTFDDIRTPRSISSTQAIPSREPAWGRWGAVVALLAAVAVSAWVYQRREGLPEETAGSPPAVEAGRTGEQVAHTPVEEGGVGTTGAVVPPGEDFEEDLETEAGGVESPEDSPEDAAATDPPPEEPPPPPAEGTLVLPAAWNPRIEVVIGDSSTPVRLDRERRIDLPPGRYPLEFGLYEDSYSDARKIDATVTAGEENRVRIPILPPAILRVQPRPTSPSDSGFVRLGNRRLGPTGIARDYKVPPGRYTLLIYRDPADEDPTIRESIELQSRERLVASFSYRTNDVILHRTVVRDP